MTMILAENVEVHVSMSYVNKKKNQNNFVDAALTPYDLVRAGLELNSVAVAEESFCSGY